MRAAPLNAFTLWKPENVRVITGAGLVGHFMKTSMSDRQYCSKCGGHLMTNHPPLGRWTCMRRRYRVWHSHSPARQLCRDGAARKGRVAQAQRPSRRVGRFGNCPARISLARKTAGRAPLSPRWSSVTKRTPETSRPLGLYRLLPQLVGSFDPGGIGDVGGWGCRPVAGIKTNSAPARQVWSSSRSDDRFHIAGQGWGAMAAQ